ncbi:hypothetical protein [Agromyces mediolanus]|jgi:hypothetical protein|uniref:hypothetical protein n=1 Tax=Agromyces mediolanus TaxID=41986 RepID=UPI001E4BC3C2|nr:hypothetical protein [Agromyces mediolanus]MCD1570785.1 hypothetical protein [Agromyces mediolanus]
MITSRELRAVLLHGPYLIATVVVFGVGLAFMVLFATGLLGGAAIAWIPFAVLGLLLLGASVARRRRHEAD